MAKTMEEIARLLANTRFKKRIFGGVSPADLWLKLERLQKEYEELVLEERAKSQGRLEERDEIIARLEDMLRRTTYQQSAQAPNQTSAAPETQEAGPVGEPLKGSDAGG